MRRELVEARGIRVHFEPVAGLLADLAVEDGDAP